MSCGPADGSAAGGSGSDERNVVVLNVETRLRAPVWSPEEGAIFALGRDGQRLLKVDVSRGGFNPDAERPQAVASAEELDGAAGKSLVLEKDREPDRIYVPVPEKDEVFVLEPDDLLEVQTFEAGESPARLALEPRGAGTLFALSESGRTLTAVDLAGHEVVAEAEVGVREATLLGTYRGFDDFRVWVAGPGGVALHGGASLEPRATAQIEATSLAVGTGEAERAYVGEVGSGRVLAVEFAPDGELEVVAARDVGAEARYLESEEDRLYAATDNELVVLDGDGLKPIASVDLRPALNRKSIAKANLSGLAVGEEHVYLTLERKPYVLQVEKP